MLMSQPGKRLLPVGPTVRERGTRRLGSRGAAWWAQGRRGLAAGLVPLLSLACLSVGPKTIPRDRVEYVQALRDSWKRQILLNIVSLRYAEAPMFLEVASVINQYSLEGNVDAGFNWLSGNPDAQGIGAGGRFADRPTITYTPLTGERYVRNMLTPLPPASILSMVQSGWPVDFVFRLTVRSINGISSPGGSRFMSQTTRDSEFLGLLDALRRIQMSGAIGMRVEKVAGHDAPVVFFMAPRTPAETADFEVVRKTLDLDPGRREFRLTFGPVPADGSEIAILSRSMVDLMIELAAWMDVPPDDLAAGRTGPPHPPIVVDGAEVPPLLRIQWTDEEPKGAFAAVRYGDHWFHVSDNDMESKKTLSFLMILLSLSESGGAQGTPVVTVGAGGG